MALNPKIKLNPKPFRADSEQSPAQRGFGVIAVIIAVAALTLLIGGGLYAKEKLFTKHVPVQQACTQEAKQCPDGSYVGRTGPNCEFAACPTTTTTSTLDTSAWKTYRNEKYGFEVKYPNDWVVSSGLSDWGKTIFYIAKVDLYALFSEPGPGTFYQKGRYSNLSIEPGYCDYDFIKKNPQNITINGITSQRGDSGYLSWVIFSGDPARGWDAKCNTIRLEVSSADNKITDEGRVVEKKVLEQILSTFKFITPSTSAAGALAGKISIGPICPAETIPPQPGCTPSPETYASQEFLVLSSDQTRTVTTFHADASGNYRVLLQSGTYVVVSAKTGTGFFSKDLPKTVTIQTGKTATLDISVDTGIR